MEVGEKFLEFLDANPKASVNVFEGDKTKSMVFDGGAIFRGVGVMDLMKAREKFAEINLQQGFYTQEELEFTDLGVFECAAAEQDFDMWWECLIYYAQPLVDQKEKALLEQFEINNKLVEQVEKLKAQAVPDGFVVVPEEPTERMLDSAYSSISDNLHYADLENIYKAMIWSAQEPAND